MLPLHIEPHGSQEIILNNIFLKSIIIFAGASVPFFYEKNRRVWYFNKKKCYLCNTNMVIFVLFHWGASAPFFYKKIVNVCYIRKKSVTFASPFYRLILLVNLSLFSWGALSPFFLWKKQAYLCLVGTMCTSSLHGISMVMIALFFLKLFPPTPLEVWNVPLFRGVPAGRGILFRKKKWIFFVLL